MEVQEGQFEATTLSEDQADAMVTALQRDTPLSLLSHDEARRVFDRALELGYIVAREVK